MTVYFLRHGSAGQSHKDPAKDDKRGLDRVGIEQCARAGRVLASLDAHIDEIISSPLKRATQSAALVANEIGHEGAVLIAAALRPDAAYAAFQQLLEDHGRREAILVVGHNPSLPQFLGGLIADHSHAARIDLRKGALAKVEIERTGGELHWILTPKLARALPPPVPSAPAARPKSPRK